MLQRKRYKRERVRRAAPAFVGDQGGGLERESGNFPSSKANSHCSTESHNARVQRDLKGKSATCTHGGGREGKDFPQMTESRESWRAASTAACPWFPVGALLHFPLLQEHLQQEQGRGAVLERVEHPEEHSRHLGMLRGSCCWAWAGAGGCRMAAAKPCWQQLELPLLPGAPPSSSRT